MRIDLRKIADNPGESVAFSCDLDTGDLDFDQITAYTEKPHAEGQIRNTAGILELKGALTAPMTCLCDRCGEEFSLIKEMDLDAVISEHRADPVCPWCGDQVYVPTGMQGIVSDLRQEPERRTLQLQKRNGSKNGCA